MIDGLIDRIRDPVAIEVAIDLIRDAIPIDVHEARLVDVWYAVNVQVDVEIKL